MLKISLFLFPALGDWLRMNRLEYLDVSSNSLNATIVPFLAGLTSLKTLFLSDNQMQGRLPFKGAIILFLLDLVFIFTK